MNTAIGRLGSLGRLDLILGPMFSGKSSEVVRRIRRQKLIRRPLFVVHHALDRRYDAAGGWVITHDGIREQAHAASALTEAMATDEYARAEVVVIEEAQFFEDIVTAVKTMVERDQKHVIVAALDGDYRGEAFAVVGLVPYADTVTRLEALCSVCADGTPAPFTQRILASDERTVVGGAEAYRPVCRRHRIH